MGQKRKQKPYPRTFAGRLTRKLLLVIGILMSMGLALIIAIAVFTMTWETADLFKYAQKYSAEYVQRVLSDVYVASVNNVHEVEKNLDKPDSLQAVMERMVRQSTRIRSCGVSFIENYYPQKGRWFCPYALQRDSGEVESLVLGDAKNNYLETAWFKEALQAKEGYWSKPFLDGYEADTPLVSYMVPIRNRQGQTVAVMGVDLSLELLTQKLKEIDTELNEDQVSGTNNKRKAAYSFIIASDGTYIVHPDKERILKNYFDYTKQNNDTTAESLGRWMVAGKSSSDYDPLDMEIDLDGVSTFAFFTPVKHVDWSLCVVVPQRSVYLNGIVLGVIIFFLMVFGLLLIFGVCFLLVDSNAKPLIQLSASADEVAKGNFDAPLPAIKTHDEIHRLRDSFENMQQSLTRYVEQLKATTTEKASIESELKIAHGIQMAMLPKIFPPYPERHDIDIFGQLTPAKAVGGDLFDFFIRDEQLFFCIGDVSGKGVPASLVMAVTRSLFRNVTSSLSEPHKIVSALNEVIAEGNESSMFVTLFVGLFDLQTGLLQYCNAGHDSPLLIGNRGVGLLPCDSNIPVGVMPGWEFSLQQADIDSRTTIFLYTDGLTEAEDIAHAQFGEKRIFDVAEPLQKADAAQPMVLIEKMTKAVHDFVGEAEQSDDLTMLAIKYNKQ